MSLLVLIHKQYVLENNLKSYTFKYHFNLVFFWGNDEYIQELKAKTENISDTLSCMTSLATNGDRICITTKDTYIIFRERFAYLGFKYKLIKPIFNCVELRYNFEMSLP